MDEEQIEDKSTEAPRNVAGETKEVMPEEDGILERTARRVNSQAWESVGPCGWGC